MCHTHMYTTCSHSNFPTAQCTCTDVMLVVDSSGSIGADNFQAQKEFLIHLANRFDYHTTRVGVVQFANRVVLRSNLQNNIVRIRSVLTRLPYTRGRTLTGRALITAANVLNRFKRRSCETKMFVVTDGRATDAHLIQNGVNLITRFKHDVVALGITTNIDRDELLTIALSKPDNVITAADFNTLEAMATSIQEKLICRELL